MASVLFWIITQCIVVIHSWISWPLKMGPIGCSETSVRNYHCMLCNNPEECRSLPLFGSPNEDTALVAVNCLPIHILHVEVPTFGETCHLCLQGWTRHNYIYPEDGKRKLLWNTGTYLLKYQAKNLLQTREKTTLLSFHSKDSAHCSPMSGC